MIWEKGIVSYGCKPKKSLQVKGTILTVTVSSATAQINQFNKTFKLSLHLMAMLTQTKTKPETLLYYG